MRAVAVRRFQATPEVMDLPTPSAGPGEVVVHVEAAGVNPLDWKVIDGLYEGHRRHVFPLVVGADGAGTVASAAPTVRRLRVGDRVYGQFLHDPVGTGTYTEWTTVPEGIGVARIPDSWSAMDAAALPTAGMTALAALERIGIGPGRTLVLVGASGGIGSFATAIGGAEGMQVIAVVRKDSVERAKQLGAREVVALDSGDPVRELAAEYPQGVDGLLDVMDPPPEFERWSRLVQPRGTAVSTIGSASAPGSEAAAARVNVSLAPTTELLERLTNVMERHHLKAPVERKIALEDAPEALAESRAGRLRGKTVIRVGP